MAGVTTAARMGIGAISATQALAPVEKWQHLWSGTLNTNQTVSGLEALSVTHGVTDMTIYGTSQNQSSWTGWGYVQLKNSLNNAYNNDRMRYQGGQVGSSWSGSSGYTAAIYNNGYSNYCNMWQMHVQNAFLDDRPKLCELTYSTAMGSQPYNAVGGSINWWNNNTKIDALYVYDNYGSGTSSYQFFSIYGSVRK
tara:strand:- start:1754 stop:2338 length:585 start_codon:yes stop_codon:yes gene_type:complete